MRVKVKVPCAGCGKLFQKKGIATHLKYCKKFAEYRKAFSDEKPYTINDISKFSVDFRNFTQGGESISSYLRKRADELTAQAKLLGDAAIIMEGR